MSVTSFGREMLSSAWTLGYVNESEKPSSQRDETETPVCEAKLVVPGEVANEHIESIKKASLLREAYWMGRAISLFVSFHCVNGGGIQREEISDGPTSKPRS